MRDRRVVRQPGEFGARQVECGRALDFAPQARGSRPRTDCRPGVVCLHDDAHAIGAEVVQIGGAGRKPLTVHGLGPGQKGSGDCDEEDAQAKHFGTSVVE